ncbi:MAG TPA: hypothetical protein VHU77_01620 [Candidatus Limnocylindria bacterium]|jgi:hypothetical protein|nr:hypothetical protein [Candidatus Limnocylindria bacterium]
MSATYLPTSTSRRRGGVVNLVGGIDDFMSWMLYGQETWLVATLKALAIFLFMYFLLFYIPNYIYYGLTLYIPFLKFSKDVGFLVANLIGGGNFTALIVLTVWTQAARGRRGFFWSLVRYLDFLQLLLTLFVLIPFMTFNLAGGSLIPPIILLSVPDGVTGILGFLIAWRAILLGLFAAGLGLIALAYLYLEYLRVARREAEIAAATSAALQART